LNLKDWCKKNSKHRLAGKVAAFPVADGYAEYMVLDGRRLIHLPLGDSYDFPYIERLRLSDIEARIKQSEGWAKLFRKQQEERAGAS
jgi:hypothetical protein